MRARRRAAAAPARAWAAALCEFGRASSPSRAAACGACGAARTGESPVEGVLCGDGANVDQPLLPDAVVGQELLDLVEARAELLGKAVHVVAQPDRHVHRHATRPDVGGVHARARDALVKLHQLLALLEEPQQRRERADVEGVARDGEQVVEDPRDLEEHHADHLRAPRHLALDEALDRHRVAVLRRHHRDVVEAVKVGERLHVRLVLDQLLRPAVEQPDVRVGARDHLAVHLEDEPQHAVRGRVLRPKVHREVLDLGLVLHVERDVGAQLGARRRRGRRAEGPQGARRRRPGGPRGPARASERPENNHAGKWRSLESGAPVGSRSALASVRVSASSSSRRWRCAAASASSWLGA